MKNIRKVIGNLNRAHSAKVPLLIIAMIAILGFVFFSCEEEGGVSVSNVKVGSLPAAPEGIASITNEAEADTLMEALSTDIEAFVGEIMEWAMDSFGDLGDLFGSDEEDDPDMYLYSMRKITEDKIDIDLENGKIDVRVSFDKEPITKNDKTLLTGNIKASGKIDYEKETGSISGNLNAKLVVDEDSFKGNGEFKAEASYKMTTTATTVKSSLAVGVGLTAWDDTSKKGMKVVANLSANVNETIKMDQSEAEDEAQQERIMKGIKGNLIIYDLSGKEIMKYSIEELMALIPEDEEGYDD